MFPTLEKEKKEKKKQEMKL